MKPVAQSNKNCDPKQVRKQDCDQRQVRWLSQTGKIVVPGGSSNSALLIGLSGFSSNRYKRQAK